MRANLLWDDPEYTLAMDVKGDREKAIAKNNLFIERIEDEKLFEIPDVAALITFLKNPDKLESLAKIAPESIEELRLASFIFRRKSFYLYFDGL